MIRSFHPTLAELTSTKRKGPLQFYPRGRKIPSNELSSIDCSVIAFARSAGWLPKYPLLPPPSEEPMRRL